MLAPTRLDGAGRQALVPSLSTTEASRLSQFLVAPHPRSPEVSASQGGRQAPPRARSAELTRGLAPRCGWAAGEAAFRVGSRDAAGRGQWGRASRAGPMAQRGEA